MSADRGGAATANHAQAPFADGARGLAGLAGLQFGWTPDTFWAATPAELGALVRALRPEPSDALGSNDLARLMEAFPDG